MNATTDRTSDTAPADIATMRETAALLLGLDDAPDALAQAPADVDTLILQLRGHLQLLMSDVAKQAGRLPKESIPRHCALACVGEARRKLSLEPGGGPYGAVAYARRLARVLRALCEHYEQMTPGSS